MNSFCGRAILVLAVWLLTACEMVYAANAETTAFDASPFGIVERDDNTYGIRWDSPRKIRRLTVDFGDAALPSADALRVEYWHRNWDGDPDPVSAELSAGHTGWNAVDDWTNGEWKRAAAHIALNGRTCSISFEPSSKDGFAELKQEGVGYRKTLKIRLASDAPLPPIEHFAAFTDAVYQPLTVRISFGKPAESAIHLQPAEAVQLECFNGRVLDVRAPGLTHANEHSWTLADNAGTLEADLLMAVDPINPRYDRTIVTVRTPSRPFSFATDETARGDRILVDDLGVLVTRATDDITLDGYRKLRKEFPGRTVYDRVFHESEQTLGRAWGDMPLKRQITFTHGLPGDRNMIAQTPNGDVRISANRHWFDLQPSPRDSARKLWDGHMLELGFGLPEARRGGRELKDGYLPMVRTWWQDGPIYYEQLAVLDNLNGKLDDVRLDDPTLLLVRFRVVNTSDTETGTARLLLTSRDEHSEALAFKDSRVTASSADNTSRLRYWFDTAGKGTVAQDGKALCWTLELAPGASHGMQMAIPSITLDKDDEIAALAHRDFTVDAERICRFWREQVARGTQIDTPDAWISDFYKAQLCHQLINCYKELDSDRLHAHVGSFTYGMYLNESAMMVSDLDRRGYHEEARRNIESLLHYQGTLAFPGNYQSKEGMLYGDGGHEMGGYNKSHGYAMWLIAHHWRMTRDKAWMAKWDAQLLKACEWVIRERQATMKTNPDGSKPIDYGCLPTGGLEDVQDFWSWQATNAATDWGFRDLAAALADAGHPQAERMLAESAAYHHDLMAALAESRVRAPVVRLRDGTYIPKTPSELHTRGRAHGWIREELEGPMFLPAYQLLDPASPESRWIMQDYEDNVYISREYSYDIPNFDLFWFSRGGFSMQACLLDGPLPYLYRDEIKHFLRAYFNSFSAGFFPEVRMLNEHALPELGYCFGDHFKTSDESQSTYWLRLMFVREQGNELYLGQAIPRYWLNNGNHPGIERAATDFGPMSLRYDSNVDADQITATLTPPSRNAPATIYLRFRHPAGKKIASVTVNGKPYERFDVKKEWVILPGTLDGEQKVVANY